MIHESHVMHYIGDVEIRTCFKCLGCECHFPQKLAAPCVPLAGAVNNVPMQKPQSNDS